MRHLISLLLSLLITSCANASNAPPYCAGPENWPASMAYVKLKNAKIIELPIDPSKTKVQILLNEKIGDDLYRQLHKVTFVNEKGIVYNVLTLSDSSSSECSMSDVTVYKIQEIK